MISLFPIIPEFLYYQGLSIPWEQLNQALLATSFHPQDNDTHVYQYVAETKGWPLSLAALETEGGTKGAFTLSEYQAIMAIINMPQVLTLTYRDILISQSVTITSCGLRPVFNDNNYCDDTLFVGSINFIRM